MDFLSLAIKNFIHTLAAVRIGEDVNCSGMNDFSSVPVPSSGGLMPQTFSPSALSSKLPEQSLRSSKADVVGEEGDLSHLVAQPYGERPRKPVAKEEVVKKIEKAEEKKEIESEFSLKVGTGAAFKRTGRGGLDKKLAHLAMKDKVTFSGISESDRKLIGDIIGKHAKNLSTGSELDRMARLEMKESVQHAHTSGTITDSDRRKMLTIIDELH